MIQYVYLFQLVAMTKSAPFNLLKVSTAKHLQALSCFEVNAISPKTDKNTAVSP